MLKNGCYVIETVKRCIAFILEEENRESPPKFRMNVGNKVKCLILHNIYIRDYNYSCFKYLGESTINLLQLLCCSQQEDDERLKRN